MPDRPRTAGQVAGGSPWPSDRAPQNWEPSDRDTEDDRSRAGDTERVLEIVGRWRRQLRHSPRWQAAGFDETTADSPRHRCFSCDCTLLAQGICPRITDPRAPPVQGRLRTGGRMQTPGGLGVQPAQRRRCKACFPPLPQSRRQPSGRIPRVAGLSRGAAGPARARAGRHGFGETVTAPRICRPQCRFGRGIASLGHGPTRRDPDVRRESRGGAARGGRGAVEAAPAGAVLTHVSPEFAPRRGGARRAEAGGGADLPQPPRHVRRPPLVRISPSAGRPGLPRPAGRLLLLRSDHQDHAGRVRAHVVRRPPQRDVQDSALAVASDDDEINLDLGGDLDDQVPRTPNPQDR